MLLGLGMGLLLGCSGGGGGGASTTAPTGLTYTPAAMTLTKGTAMDAITPACAGTQPFSFSVSPALPAGLSIDSSTGVLSGTPTAAAAQADYVVTATNGAGHTTATLTVTVNDLPVTGFSYTPSTMTLTRTTAMGAITPAHAGGTVTSYSVSPALPAGLSVNASTGVLSGTPTATAAQATYTVTANYVGGSVTTTVTITVNEPAITGFSYTPSTMTLTRTLPMGAITPAHAGGTVTSFSVSPALPAGLSVNTSTGVLSGTPSTTAAQATYTVTANYVGGSVTTTVTITVNDVPVTGFSYTPSTMTLTKGTAMGAITPAHGGGTVTSFSVSPALPTGLSVNASTGVLGGTPSVTAAQTTYTVTANYLGGSLTTTVTITINDAAVATVTYSPNPAKYTNGVAIASNHPSTTGGTATTYSVSPALPTGLSLDTGTGVISGKPTVSIAQTTYTVTAGNITGSAQALVKITIYDQPVAEIAGPLSAHPGDAWMMASVPDQDLDAFTYAWTASTGLGLAANSAKSTGAITASASTGTRTLDVTVTNPAGYPLSGTRNLVVQTGTWLVEDGLLGWPSGGGTVTALASGRVLLAGGIGPDGYPGNAAWIYDPVNGTWNATGAMGGARAYHSAALLADGRVLVCGGIDPSFAVLASSEIFDPATGTWTAAGAMTATRQRFTTTLLANGKVLAAGGRSANVLNSTDLFDPASGPNGTWTASGDMTAGHMNHTATLLNTGKVLVAGGENDANASIGTSELYNPANGTWTATASLATERYGATATLLPSSGKVLVTGGEALMNGSTVTSELFDPAANGGTGGWTATGDLVASRTFHTATLLQDNTVLVAGGSEVGVLHSAEIYTPGTGTWATTTGDLTYGRVNHGAALLPDGRVLVAGGFGAAGLLPTGASNPRANKPASAALASSELFNPATGTWSTASRQGRQNHTATLLGNGKVLVVGGTDETGTPLATVRIYDPATRAWSPAASMGTARAYHTATVLSSSGADTTVLVVGGISTALGAVTDTTEIYDSQANAWNSAGLLATGRTGHTATLLPGGTDVLITGGSNGVAALATTEVYSTGFWSSGPDLNFARLNHTATLLGDGTVLVTGGKSGANALASVELLAPDRLSWDWIGTGTTGPMGTARQLHTATLLPDGTVLVTGGAEGDGLTALAGSELYIPGTGWTPVSATLPSARFLHAAVALGTSLSRDLGGALVVGGYDGGALGSTLLYTASKDVPSNTPIAGTWVYSTGSVDGTGGSLSAPRFGLTLTDLGNGSFLACQGNGADGVAEIYVPTP